MKPGLKIVAIRRLGEVLGGCDFGKTAVLVASSYDAPSVKLPPHSIVQIFDDVDYEIPGRSLSREQAQAYAGFVKGLPKDTETIVCACNAGESRSAALCAALCEYYGVDAGWIWDSPNYHPNMYVFGLFAEALGMKVDDEQLDALYYRNRKAFTDAIRRQKGK